MPSCVLAFIHVCVFIRTFVRIRTRTRTRAYVVISAPLKRHHQSTGLKRILMVNATANPHEICLVRLQCV